MKGVIKMAIRFLSMPIRQKSTLEERQYGKKIIEKKLKEKSILAERKYCLHEDGKVGKGFKNGKGKTGGTISSKNITKD